MDVFIIPLLRMNKILITGGSGFIGRFFIERLSGYNLVNLDLKEPDFNSASKFLQGDIRNSQDVDAASSQCDTIIHLAALHHDFGISESEYFDTNVVGARILIQNAEKNGIKTIINFSSVAVYGNKGNPGPTDESDTPNPLNPYGKSKLKAEDLFRQWAEKDNSRKLIIVRSTVVFGPHNLANVLNLIKVIDRGLFVHVNGGKAIKSIAYVENIVDATLFAAEKIISGTLIFNYSDEPSLSIREIAELQAGLLKRKIRFALPLWVLRILAIPFDMIIALTGKNLKISSGRIRKITTQTYHSASLIRSMGFTPRYSIHYGMERMIRWYESTKKD